MKAVAAVGDYRVASVGVVAVAIAFRNFLLLQGGHAQGALILYVIVEFGE